MTTSSRYPTAPSGHVRTTPNGRELVLERTFRAPIADVWASLTEPERFARWFGTMTGETGAGRTIQVAMSAEEGAPTEDVLILECDPPRRVVVELDSQGELWHLSVDLAEADGTTTLTLVHVLVDETKPEEVGPGWEFYADRFTAARDGVEMPDWEADAYLATLGPHYAAS